MPRKTCEECRYFDYKKTECEFESPLMMGKTQMNTTVWGGVPTVKERVACRYYQEVEE